MNAEEDKAEYMGHIDLNMSGLMLYLYIILNIIGLFAFGLLMASIGDGLNDFFDFLMGFNRFISALIILIGSILSILIAGIIHESLHGIGPKRIGFKPKYGFLWKNKIPVFYTTFKGYIYRDQFLLFILLPFLILTPTSIIMMILFYYFQWYGLYFLTGFFLIFNSLGSIGDFYLTYMVIKYPKSIIFEEVGDPDIDPDLKTRVWTSSQDPKVDINHIPFHQINKITNKQFSWKSKEVIISFIAIFLTFTFLVAIIGTMLVDIFINRGLEDYGEIQFLWWNSYFSPLDEGMGFEFGTEINKPWFFLGFCFSFSALFLLFLNRRNIR